MMCTQEITAGVVFFMHGISGGSGKIKFSLAIYNLLLVYCMSEIKTITLGVWIHENIIQKLDWYVVVNYLLFHGYKT